MGKANKAGKVKSVECSKSKEVGKGVEVGEEDGCGKVCRIMGVNEIL